MNISKTKILIFSSGRYAENLNFYFKGTKIENVTEYKYLGIFLSKSGSFHILVAKNILPNKQTMLCFLS